MSSSSFFLSSFLDSWRSGSGAGLGGGLAASSACACAAASSSASSSAASSASSSACVRDTRRERVGRGARAPDETRLVAVSVLGFSRRSAVLCGEAARRVRAGRTDAKGTRSGRGRRTGVPGGLRGVKLRVLVVAVCPRRDGQLRLRPQLLVQLNSLLGGLLRGSAPLVRHVLRRRRRRGARQAAQAARRFASWRVSRRAFLLLLFFFLGSSSEYTLCATTTGAPPELNMPCKHVERKQRERSCTPARAQPCRRPATTRRAGTRRTRRAWCVSSALARRSGRQGKAAASLTEIRQGGSGGVAGGLRRERDGVWQAAPGPRPGAGGRDARAWRSPTGARHPRYGRWGLLRADSRTARPRAPLAPYRRAPTGQEWCQGPARAVRRSKAKAGRGRHSESRRRGGPTRRAKPKDATLRSCLRSDKSTLRARLRAALGEEGRHGGRGGLGGGHRAARFANRHQRRRGGASTTHAQQRRGREARLRLRHRRSSLRY